MSVVLIILQAWMLVVALAIDAFVCSFSYGANKIKIPIKSAVIITLICSLFLGSGLLFGNIIGHYFPEKMGSWFSFIILFFLGMSKLFDSTIKNIIRKYNGIKKDFTFSLFQLGFVLQVYADPEEADVDSSKVLSPKEATPLAIALSIDGLGVGFGVGVAAANAALLIGLSLISNMLAVIVGSYVGNKIAQKTSVELSWLSGVILIIIAMMQII